MADDEFEEVFFPYDSVRPIQDELIRKIKDTVLGKQNLVVHAPTGLGKTAAALAPSIREALKHDLTVFFLTSRHTQHKLAMETVRHIKDRHTLDFFAVDIIGKKWLCLQPNVTNLNARDFSSFCKNMREDDICEFYMNTRQKGEASKIASEAVVSLKKSGDTSTANIMEVARKNKLCPYELALLVAKEAQVIIGDYYYVFHPSIRESFMKRCGKELSKSIIIIDEGHNLPDRIKDLSSFRTSTFVVSRAMEEARKNNKEDIASFLESLSRKLVSCGEDIRLPGERYVSREEVVGGLREEYDYEEMLSSMEFLSGLIREEQHQSYVGAVLDFLLSWEDEAEGYARILSKVQSLRGEEVIVVQHRCLDPAIVAREVLRSAYSTILMSGTLNPTGMYREVLGFDSAEEASFKSPFPEKNKLNIIIPKTSTKYETRGENQYREMADIISRITNIIPGNSAVFFPSYFLKDEVEKFFSKLSDKTVFSERPKFTKQEKLDFLESFKKYKDSGAVLFGVISGNFSEGVDLPGDLLKCVVIVGLPLQRPDLETESLIKYYDEKFKKGWDYGYLLPAFNKALQSAGRCIRTETDKGVIVFLDERYAWKNYFRCFPANWDIKITLLFERLIRDFFGK
ncbi:ATP-dependent DNA helicase [Candidatus Woesearchaeota archaeon]|nr:ATP-dependent DNA helicase [Candidatus Woesearchaeota archaeon]